MKSPDTILPDFAKLFFDSIDKEFGPFDRPFQFRPFPFETGGALNFLTIGAGKEQIVTYVSWDLIGQAHKKLGNLGQYELLAVCDDEEWCLDIITNIGRQTLVEVFESGDIMDIYPWSKKYSSNISGMLFDEAFSIQIEHALEWRKYSLLRCVGITSQELEFARKYGSQILIDRLKSSNVYPKTILGRASVNLA